MAKFNTNGNAYTIIYATVIVVIVAFLLAFVASSLKPVQEANVAIDKKQQILSALNLRGVSANEAEAKYAEVIELDPIFGSDASKPIKDGTVQGKGGQHDQTGFLIATKDIKKECRPLYVAKIDGQIKYIIPVKGAGLWGGLWGYIALNDDCETVYGAYFSHEGETAGLGARITEDWFQTSFNGKKIYADGNDAAIALSVVKKGKEGTLNPDNYVNGITGATLTSNGVNDMIQSCLSDYNDILKAYKN